MQATKAKPAAASASKRLVDVFELPDRLLKVLSGRGYRTLGDVARSMKAAGYVVCQNWLWDRAFMELTWEDCEAFHAIYCDEMGIE